MDNRPQGRKKNVTGQGSGLHRRGSGLGTGPVGNPGGYSGKPTNNRPAGGTNFGTSGGQTRSGGSGGMMKIIVFLLALLFGGGAGMGSLLGGEGGQSTNVPQQPAIQPSYTTPQNTNQEKPYDPLELLFGASGFGSTGSYAPTTSYSNGWLATANTGKLDTSVDPAARAKRTTILGGGRDTVTIMLYMCGTDLESQGAMGTKDLQEMANATIGQNVNLIVYTGGCRRWRNNVISSTENQIYQIRDGGLTCLNKNAGSGTMTSPNTLASFIDFCSRNFPANRNMLILWDHGGGSISGYGYDEKRSTDGSMSLAALSQALASTGVKFDCIGFDACLMATLETGLTMADYADYLIASEETEPGVGWFYTNWLTALSRDTSMPTVELGKLICDDFVNTCAQTCRGQAATLSVIDLAQLENTVPRDLTAFSQTVSAQLKDGGYASVAKARSSAREFAVSNKIDHIDLAHFALLLDSAEGKTLAGTLLSAVKYNKTSSGMTNAYGLSAYFPYQKLSGVNKAVSTYRDINMNTAYTDCIRSFASMQSGGQSAAGGTTSPVTALSGGSYGSQSVSSDMMMEMLEQLFGASVGESFYDRSIDTQSAAQFLSDNRFDPDALLWDSNGTLHLSEQQWALVQDLELNVFADDGEGYIDLGMDTVFSFTDSGDLVGTYDGTWLAIDGQNIAYYHTDTTVDGEHYTITGRVPVLLNGVRADLILVFTDEQPYGYIAGARTDYRDGETETVAKSFTELQEGDTIDFLCDYYSYDGEYLDSFMLGEQHIYSGDEQISDVYIGAEAVATYRFTDIYHNSFWTPAMR